MFSQECLREVRLRFRYHWRLLAALLVPIILSPITWSFKDENEKHLVTAAAAAGSSTQDPNLKFKTAYVILIMAVYWIFEVIPLAVTALFPLVLFPFLGIQHASTVSQNYMKESNMIFLGGIILALAIEYSNLHIRGALAVIRVFGANPARITLGIMLITAFLSMWISDTSTATMFIPIVSALTTAMFREEQEALVEEDEVQTDDTQSATETFTTTRTRRESLVFANSALQSSRRRRHSRRSSSIKPKSTTSPTSLSTIVSESSSSSNSNQDSSKSISDSGFSMDAGVSNSDNLLKDMIQTASSPSLRHVRLPSMSKIKEGIAQTSNDNKGDAEEPAPESEHDAETGKKVPNRKETLELQHNIRKMLLFAVAYGTSIGGTGSLIGTGPIKVFKELAKSYHKVDKDKLVGITFFTWMSFNVPPLLLNLFIAWGFLVIRYLGLKAWRSVAEYLKDGKKMHEYLTIEYGKLGAISAHQSGVLSVFILVVLLWLLRDPQLFDGWDAIDPSTDNGDSTVAMFGVLLLFTIPRDWTFLNCSSESKYVPTTAPGKYEALLDWKFVSTNAPWGYILLIGSGYAIADAADTSGLSTYIGNGLVHLQYLPKPVLLLIVIIVTSVFTELASNTACANLILPILFSLSCPLKIHPTYLTMPSAVAASYAFMLPISSPPNAIIFATGELSMQEMFWNGLFLNLACAIVLYGSVLTYGEIIFQFSQFNPEDHNFNTCDTMSSQSYAH